MLYSDADINIKPYCHKLQSSEQIEYTYTMCN